MQQPLLSIITVCKNDLENLKKTHESIAAQTFSDYEIIVVDGGSNDGTTEWLQSTSRKEMRFISEPDNGLYDAMNKGIAMAKGTYLNFLNAGDIYYDEDVLSAVLTENNKQGFDLLFGDVQIINPGSGENWQQPAQGFSRDLLIRYGTGAVCHQAVFVKKHIVPIYNLKYPLKAELNWYFDIIENVSGLTIKYIPKPLIRYATGGKGYVKFYQNLKENTSLIYKRYGLKKMIKYKYYEQVFGKFAYRYNWIRATKNKFY